jgi:hypothetical protein
MSVPKTLVTPTRLEASDWKAIVCPSWETEGFVLSPFPGCPKGSTLTSWVTRLERPALKICRCPKVGIGGGRVRIDEFATVVPAAVVVVMAAPVVEVDAMVVPVGGNVVTTESVVPAGVPVVLADVAPRVVAGGRIGIVPGTPPGVVPGKVPGTVPGKVPRVVGLVVGGKPEVTPAATPPSGFPVDSNTTKSPPAEIMAFVLSLIVPGAARPIETSMFVPVNRVKTKISLPPLEEVMLPVRRVEVDWKATSCPS